MVEELEDIERSYGPNSAQARAFRAAHQGGRAAALRPQQPTTPYDRRLGDLRERANRLAADIREAEQDRHILPAQVDHHKNAARVLQGRIDASVRFLDRHRPELVQLEQEIHRLEAEQRAAPHASGLPLPRPPMLPDVSTGVEPFHPRRR